MDYNEINNLLSNLEVDNVDENSTENSGENMNEPIIKKLIMNENIKEKETIEDIGKNKKKMNDFLCFRDIDLKQNQSTELSNKNKIEPTQVNKEKNDFSNKLNNRTFDINFNNNYKPPIMDFYPKFTRNQSEH
tara:strand:- start:1582 stop:1980 length:399 start_codon:yes stop_codon:yes gene_type:complete